MASTEEWTERVEAWRRSGLTAKEFSEGRGFAASTLRWYSSRLGSRAVTAGPKAAMVHVGVVRGRERIVLEVAEVRVHVPEGVDPATLRTVLGALLEASERT